RTPLELSDETRAIARVSPDSSAWGARVVPRARMGDASRGYAVEHEPDPGSRRRGRARVARGERALRRRGCPAGVVRRGRRRLYRTAGGVRGRVPSIGPIAAARGAGRRRGPAG